LCKLALELFGRLGRGSLLDNGGRLSLDGGSGDEVDVDAAEIGLDVHLASGNGVGLSLLIDDNGGLLDVSDGRLGGGGLERTLLLLRRGGRRSARAGR